VGGDAEKKKIKTLSCNPHPNLLPFAKGRRNSAKSHAKDGCRKNFEDIFLSESELLCGRVPSPARRGLG
jgi:hypothetical protein